MLAADRQAFDQWLEQANAAELNQYAEFFYALQLSRQSNLSWTVMQQLLSSRRQWERLSADPLSANSFVNAQLIRAQRELLQATRCGLDQIAPQWAQKTEEILQQVRETLQLAQQQRDQIDHAFQLRNQTLVNLPHILQWRALASEHLGNRDVDAAVDGLLDGLEQLNLELAKTSEVDPADLQFQTRLIDQWSRRLEHTWRPTAETVLGGRSMSVSSPDWTLDALLSSALFRGPIRNKLLALKSAPFAEDGSVALTTVASTAATTSSWNVAKAEQQRQRQAALHQRLMATVGWRGSWQQFSQDLLPSLQTLTKQTARDLPERLNTLRRADLMLRMLSATEAARFNGQAIENELHQLQLLFTIQSRLRLLAEAFPDALPSELPWLRGQHEQMHQLLGRLSQNQTATDRALETAASYSSRIVSGGARTLSLIAEPTADAAVTWRNVGAPLEAAWIVVDYDPALIDIESVENASFYRAAALPAALDQIVQTAEQQLVVALDVQQKTGDAQAVLTAQQKLAEAKARQLYPPRPTASALRPSTELRSGQGLTIPYKVRRIGRGIDQTKIVWKLISAGEYIRHETVIRLPATEKLRLRIDGPSGGWTETPEGVVVHPWPNRPTEFRIGLLSAGGQTRNLNVEVLKLDERRELTLPDGFVDEETSREILGRLGSAVTIASLPAVTVEGNNQVNWLDLGGAKRSGEAASPENGPATDSGKADNSQAKDDPSAKPIGIRHGLVILLTDIESKQKMWRRVDTRVRHPRSYVTPTIGYDSLAERIQIHVKPTAPLESIGKSVSVTGHVVDDVPQGTEMLLAGIINDNQGVKLFCQLPVTAPPDLTIALDVDDFPRAFVFKVPCWRTQMDIPYQTGEQRISILEPLAGTALAPEAGAQNVRLQVDALAGAFASTRDYVEIGWDIDRDREFAQERVIRIGADRDVDVQLEPPKSDRLIWLTQVSDLSLTLPPPPVKNARINLLARLVSGGETVWSQPVEIVADGDPPTLAGIGVLPASSLVRGTEVIVQLSAEDAGLAGVENIELIRDIKLTGQWDNQSPPIAAERTPEGDWTAKIATKELPLGRVNYLVRAIDRVGNQSQIGKFNLELFSEEQWADRLAQTGQEISGTLVYGDAPLASAAITLEDEKGKLAYKATTDAQGLFRLPKVAVGKYKLKAIGVAKNRPRLAESQLEVPPPPAPPIRLQLRAK